MAKPNNSIKSIKLPNESIAREIIPDSLGSNGYLASLPALSADTTIATESFVNNGLNAKQDKITADNKLDFSLIDNAPSTPEYTISKDGDIYKLLKDGQQVGVSINIPKDLVVDSGKVETIDGKTYIILVLNDAQKTEIKIEADKLIDIYNGDNTTIIVDENRQISVKSGVFQPKGNYALKSDIPTNHVTIDTEQTITGYKTFNAPANIGSTEQFTAKFKTSNGGSISFGKEAANSGTMLRFDQVDGTCRLRFRGSATAGAIVWEQPETGAALYFDLGNGNNKHRITMPNKQGTLALKSDIIKTESSTINGNIKINGTETQVYRLPSNVVTGGVPTDNNYTNQDKAAVATIDNKQDALTQTSLFSLLGLGTLNKANTWGTVKGDGGYTILLGGDQPSGGGLAIGEKNGQTHIQIDGDFYGREGEYQCAYLGYSGQGGSFYASNVYASSDRRLKENIKDATVDSLDIINKIKIKEYNFIADETKQKNVGVIAQELREALPEDLVNFYIQGKETEDDHLSVNDSKLVYLLIDAIQKQQKEITDLKERIAKLEKN